MKPFKAMEKAWGLAYNPLLPTQGIADNSLLRNALPYPQGPTVGDVRTLIRIIESVYGEIPL